MFASQARLGNIIPKPSQPVGFAGPFRRLKLSHFGDRLIGKNPLSIVQAVIQMHLTERVRASKLVKSEPPGRMKRSSSISANEPLAFSCLPSLR